MPNVGNGYGIIKERVNNLIREVREGNTEQKAIMGKMEKLLQEHIIWSQEVVTKYEKRMAKLEFLHEGPFPHSSLGSLIRLFKRI